jgi:ABC-2 type transport system permease protein
MFGRLWQMLVKEFLQLKRDRWARMQLILPPLIQMLVFPYAATFEVNHVATIVLDRDQSQESRELVSRFAFSGRFDIKEYARNDAELAQAINRSHAAMAVVVHAGFAESLRKGQAAPLQVIVDGTNSNTALLALGYLNVVTAKFSQDYAPGRAVTLTLDYRPWFNPDFNGRWFFVPGVIGSLIMIIVVNLTAFAIVREREAGTLEQIMVTPMRRLEYILGKTVPFFLLGLGEVLLVTVFGILWYRVPFVGNPLVLLAGTVLFLFSLLGLGLALSTVAKTQQQAFAANFMVLNPLFTLSGFAFPIASMPEAMRLLTYLNPLRYYLVVIRATFLKGVGMDALWPDMLGMFILGASLLTFSVLRFRKSLD